MRLTHVNDRSIRDIREDTARVASIRALTWEYRVTYREELNEAEKIREGRMDRAFGGDRVGCHGTGFNGLPPCR
jgi:hypothetical protein